MNKFKKWQLEVVGKDMTEVLIKYGYNAFYADNTEEAKQMILDMIPHGSSIALGGSETISAMNLLEVFRNGNYNLYDRYVSKPFPEIVEIMRQSMLADFLVTGTNAITRNGELVNVDSSGNRAAGMIFGPKKVIVAASAAKVVEDLEAAFARLREIAPMNAKRVKHDTPCVASGHCEDCKSPRSVCNSISIINHGMKFEGRISIILIGEEVGF